MRGIIKKTILLAGFSAVIFLLLTPLISAEAKQKENGQTGKEVKIDLFYSPTCPHCSAEKEFLHNYLLEKYSQISLEEKIFTDQQNKELLRQKLKEHNKENYFGVVPITFVEDNFFAGFDDKSGIGAEIEKAVKEELSGKKISQNKKELSLPLIGSINVQNYSLPALAVILGFLDGFNVCSLGALILILGLALTLRDRKKILIYGGAFVGMTALIYGFLILLWNQLFSILSSCIPVMEAIISVVGIAGGIYFFKEFFQYRKYGPSCDTSGTRIVARLSKKVKETLHQKGTSFALLGSILIFAALLTIIEFPCSAAVPVAFAGILAEQGISTSASLLYIAIFVLFYMLDELVIFAIAAYKMNIKTASSKFTTWAVLVEALALTGLGLYYLWGTIGCLF